MESASELYTTVLINEEESVNEKIFVLSECIRMAFDLKKAFGENTNFLRAMNYIEQYFFNYLFEIDKEHCVYIAMRQYFERFDFITDADEDEEMLRIIGEALDQLTESFSNRVDEFQEYLFFCDNLIYNGFLTRKNYVYKPFMEHFSEDDEVKLLQLLGGDK